MSARAAIISCWSATPGHIFLRSRAGGKERELLRRGQQSGFTASGPSAQSESLGDGGAITSSISCLIAGSSELARHRPLHQESSDDQAVDFVGALKDPVDA